MVREGATGGPCCLPPRGGFDAVHDAAYTWKILAAKREAVLSVVLVTQTNEAEHPSAACLSIVPFFQKNTSSDNIATRNGCPLLTL